MTMHVVYDNQCKDCGGHYIPFDVNTSCPNCGMVGVEQFDYISQAVASMRVNKLEGSYMPGAWWVGSLGDHILHIMFNLFDEYENNGQDKDFATFAGAFLPEMGWGEQKYLQKHVMEIAVRISQELYHDDELGR
jgi:hypothetical protein